MILRLIELGIVGEYTQRVVIDASVRDVVKVHVEELGDERLLEVARELDGIVITRE